MPRTKQQAETVDTGHFVFVYGTLKTGQYNHARLLKNNPGAKFVCKARTDKKYCLFQPSISMYPYCADVSKDAPELAQHVEGEVFRVDAETLRNLDRLEGYPAHYGRGPVDICEVDLPDGNGPFPLAPGKHETVLFYHVPFARVANMPYAGANWPLGASDLRADMPEADVEEDDTDEDEDDGNGVEFPTTGDED